jgi:glyceraldehyde-3-phosphate dehydrogenase (NAD(P))
MSESKVRVAVTGYGVIGKRVAEAVTMQPDMTVAGVADVANDWRMQVASQRGFTLFGANALAAEAMKAAGLSIDGTLRELLEIADVVVDCTPKKVAAANIATYKAAAKKFILHGGEKHEATGHSFVAEASYADAVGRASTRVVSCNTTSIVRTLGALKRAGLLKSARGTLLRRATDPWESHETGIMNTLVPEVSIPSHQGPDAQSVDPELDVVTMAVKVPQTLGHLHYWNVRMPREAGKDEILDALRTSTRIALIRGTNGLVAINSIKEWMLDIGRPHGDLYEVALWEDMLTIRGDELFYAYMVDNQAIVIPETIDAIRAICDVTPDAARSMSITNSTLGIGDLTAAAVAGQSQEIRQPTSTMQGISS